jgi:thiol-disulfide isomerase/thioredoxin
VEGIMPCLRPHSSCTLCRFILVALIGFFVASPAIAGLQKDQKADSPSADGPKDPKAIKTFQSAIAWQNMGASEPAISAFRKAFKQDNGQCWSCISRAYALAAGTGAYKQAEEIAHEWLSIASTNAEKGAIHYALGTCIENEGIAEKKDKYFSDTLEEFQAALSLDPSIAAAHYSMGIALAYLKRDDEAKAAFNRFLEQDHRLPDLHLRAARYMNRIELARAKLAPPFSLTTIDGQKISLDSLAGKVVLIDFWASWCVPCRDAFPHMRAISHKFEGRPFVLLSINLDKDAKEWRDFVARNDMPWTLCHEDGFDGNVAKLFNVRAIPSTFSIDADGVLEDQHVGDANIEGKLKKMIDRAVEISGKDPASAAETHAGG